MYSTTSEMEAARGFLRCYVEKARRREEFRSWTTIVEFAGHRNLQEEGVSHDPYPLTDLHQGRVWTDSCCSLALTAAGQKNLQLFQYARWTPWILSAIPFMWEESMWTLMTPKIAIDSTSGTPGCSPTCVLWVSFECPLGVLRVFWSKCANGFSANSKSVFWVHL